MATGLAAERPLGMDVARSPLREQTNLTVIFLTGLVGAFGTSALGGCGMGARLEYLQIPLVFGFGSALVTMVGTNVGAGQRARAERVAWVGAAMAAARTGSIGVGAALSPGVWLGLFTSEPEVLQHALAAGFEAHLTKPINLDQFLSLLAESPR